MVFYGGETKYIASLYTVIMLGNKIVVVYLAYAHMGACVHVCNSSKINA